MVLMPVAIDEVSHRLLGDLLDSSPHVLSEQGWRVHDNHAVAGLNEHSVVRTAGDVVDPVANLLSYIALLEPLRIEQCPRRPSRDRQIISLGRIWRAGRAKLVGIIDGSALEGAVIV